MQAEAYIRALEKQLTGVSKDLDAMTPAQAGTEWHRDRVSEATWLCREIARVRRTMPAR